MQNLEILKEIKKGETGRGILIERDGFISIKEGDYNRTLFENFLDRGNMDPKNMPQIPFPFIIHAVFQKFDTPNANGRIYSEYILRPVVDKYQAKIQDRESYGHNDHPDSTVILIKDISHLISELHWEGKTLVGKIELPISPGFIQYGVCSCQADLVALLILRGLKIGVSSRGIGSVQERNGIHYVGDDFEIICWDIVTTPSTPGSWISTDKEKLAIYTENNIVRNDNLLTSKLDNLLKLF